MTPTRLRLAGWLSLVNAFASVPLVALLGSLAAGDSLTFRMLHAVVLVAALIIYAVTLLTLRALLHGRGIYEADALIKGVLLISGVESVLELHWLPGLTEVAREGAALAWSPLYREPRHVFFSHRLHAGGAGIACERCHPGVADARAPPPRVRPIRMSDCLDCHAKAGAPGRCTACHR